MLLPFLLIFLSSFSYALHIEVYGPCDSKPIFKGVLKSSDESIGSLSIRFMENRRIPFQGTERGFNSINGSPVGLDALEVISDQEMKSYGWCYFVDGTAPEIYPSEHSSTGVKKVQWIFSYAHYVKGNWISQCQKAFVSPPTFLCSNR